MSHANHVNAYVDATEHWEIVDRLKAENARLIAKTNELQIHLARRGTLAWVLAELIVKMQAAGARVPAKPDLDAWQRAEIEGLHLGFDSKGGGS